LRVRAAALGISIGESVMETWRFRGGFFPDKNAPTFSRSPTKARLVLYINFAAVFILCYREARGCERVLKRRMKRRTNEAANEFESANVDFDDFANAATLLMVFFFLPFERRRRLM
jgi:hypothetical protein